MLQAIIILSLILQEKAITIVDYTSKEPVPGVGILYGEIESVTDVDGRFVISSPYQDLTVTIIGWHSVFVESNTLIHVDTIYLFTNTMVLGTRKPIIKNELIKRGKIMISPGGRTQVYYYNRKNYSLQLKIEEAP